jgi:hypothetical protein
VDLSGNRGPRPVADRDFRASALRREPHRVLPSTASTRRRPAGGGSAHNCSTNDPMTASSSRRMVDSDGQRVSTPRAAATATGRSPTGLSAHTGCARTWPSRRGGVGRGSRGDRLAHLRLDGVPGTGAASSLPPPAAASAPTCPRGACGDLVARGGVGLPRCRFGRPLRVPPVPPSGDAGEDGDEDQDRGHEDQQWPLLDEQVEHRTAATRATAHLASSAVGGGRGSPGGVDAVIVPGGTAGSGDVRQRVADARFERRPSGGRGRVAGRFLRPSGAARSRTCGSWGSWSGPSTSHSTAP